MKIQPINGVYKVKFNYSKRDLVDHTGIGFVIRNKAVNDRDDTFITLYHNKFNFWTIPLAKVDEGETIKETVVRECFEELGIHVIKFKILKTFKIQRHPNNTLVNIQGYLIEVTAYSGVPYNKEEHKHKDMKWLNIRELSKLKRTSGATKQLIKISPKV